MCVNALPCTPLLRRDGRFLNEDRFIRVQPYGRDDEGFRGRGERDEENCMGEGRLAQGEIGINYENT